MHAARSTFARLRPYLQSLTIFAGVVTGLFWAVAFLLVELGASEPAFTSAADFFGAVLFFWTASVLPGLLVPAVHLPLALLLSRRLSGRRLRSASALLAPCAGPILLLDPALRRDPLVWGVPFTVLLALYGWTAGGIVETRGARTRMDRSLVRTGLALIVVLAGGLAATVAYSWIAVLVT